MSANAAVEPPRAALSSAQQAHNAMARLLRARDAVSRSAATACYAAARKTLTLRVDTSSSVTPWLLTANRLANFIWLPRNLKRRSIRLLHGTAQGNRLALSAQRVSSNRHELSGPKGSARPAEHAHNARALRLDNPYHILTSISPYRNVKVHVWIRPFEVPNHTLYRDIALLIEPRGAVMCFGM
jgi:hypothetical protein